uniref:dynamin family protein n=1 Tax=Brachyspira catarrhinii TaxID=2528966 RepID=UPI003F4B52A2
MENVSSILRFIAKKFFSFDIDEKISRISSLESLKVEHLNKISSLESLEEEHLNKISSLESLREEHLNKISSLESLREEHLNKISSLESLEEEHLNKISSLESLREEHFNKISSLESLEEEHLNKISSLESLKEEHLNKISSLESLREEHLNKISSLESLEEEHLNKISSLESLEEEHLNKISSLESLEEEHLNKISSLESLKVEHLNKISSLEILEEEHLNKISSLESLREEHFNKISSLESLKEEQNLRIKNFEQSIVKHKKVLEILSKQPDETAELIALKNIWEKYNYLVQLCDEKNLPNGGHLKRLKELCERVESAVNFPLYYHKNIIALCGQFSSGKTSMINSFLGNDVLPTSIEPTTALNTYIVYDDQDEKDELYIRNHFSGRTKIDESLYDFVTHSFSNEYHQNVRSMIRYVSLHTKKLNFRNIALLDTPGYTGESSDLSLEEDDKNMAIEGIKGADYVIWVIDITNGTIKEDDIEFLESYAKDKPKVIVLNKADLLPKSRREEVYNNIKNTLEEEGLDNIDVYLYSSLYSKDFLKTSKALFNIFTDVNKKIKFNYNIIENLKDLFRDFINYYNDIEKDLSLETEIFNIAKINSSFNLQDKVFSISSSLSQVKEERNNIEFIVKELNSIAIDMEILFSKAIVSKNTDNSCNPNNEKNHKVYKKNKKLKKKKKKK